MNDVKKFISDIISEAALDQRIPDGVVDLYNTDHVQVVAEKMYDAGANEFLINEFIERFVVEGKHPERQAYNKDGWLVTFPSKEYRDAAIKRGTHSTSDPTHGKGGMNLYYKKRGKQKRQVQQVKTLSGDDTQKEQPATPDQKPQEPAQQATAPQQKSPEEKKKRPTPGRQVAPADDAGSFEYDTSSVKKSEDPTEKDQAEPAEKPTEPVKQAPKASSQPEESPTTPQSSATVAQTSPHVDVSKKFADSKGWTSTPYGEYRDLTGEVQAVVSLSGEVVPIKSVDRDELKLFLKKSQS